MEWTTEAQEKLKEIPFFVRPGARKKIEKFATEKDEKLITAEFPLMEINLKFGMQVVKVILTAQNTRYSSEHFD